MPSKSQASQAKKTKAKEKKTRVSKRKVVPQYGGLFGFFENKNDAVAPGAAPVVAPPAPVPAPAPAAATEPAKPGFFSGWFGSNKPTEEPKKLQGDATENKGSSWWNPFGSKSNPEAAAPATANGQKGGRKRKSKK
jgi:hypothetical protein